MRFSEFKIILRESQETGFYAVGDSHAVAVAHAGGKQWTNLAIGGRASTDSAMLSNISKVPSGAVVLVSQGANDTANSMKVFIDSNGTRPLVDPQKIASNVASVVSRVKDQGATVIFLLFPTMSGKGAAIEKWYKGDYQAEVRSAIKSALNVQVIDLNGKPLTDGIHATMTVYKDVANQVTSRNVPKVAQDDKKDTKKESSVLEVPTGRVGIEVADVQKVLLALGYELPLHGVDGIRGPETTAAVKQFQDDHDLDVDGDPGPKTIAAMNKIVAEKGIKITKSTASDVKSKAVEVSDLGQLATDAVTTGKVGKVLDLIARPESGGHYDIMMGGKRNPAILKMTINELLRYQREYKARGAETAAAGRYQYMPDTLKFYCKKMGVDPSSQTFDPKFQDQLAIYTMRYQCKLDGWLDNKVSDAEFLNLLAQVWAGIPKTTGLSAYDKVGSNKAGIKVDVALNTLQDIRQA